MMGWRSESSRPTVLGNEAVGRQDVDGTGQWRRLYFGSKEKKTIGLLKINKRFGVFTTLA